MSDEKKGSQDLTRIEDLSDFIHNEEEEISLLEDNDNSSMMDMEKESFGESTSFMQIPAELSSENTEDEDLSFNESNFEDESQDFSTNFDNETSNEESFSNNDFDESDELNDFENTDTVDDQFEPTNDTFETDSFDSSDFSNNDFSEEATEMNQLQTDDSNDSEQIFADNDDFETEENEGSSFDSDISIEQEEEKEEEKEEPTIEEIQEKTLPPPPIEAPKNFKSPESLSDIKEFAEVITSTDLSIEGNPPFSIILSKIKYHEDSIEILNILKEFKIIKDEQEDTARASLERGQILIPRLSEYAAIILCHKLRRFDLNLKMGLSQEIHENSTFETSDKGLISKKSILSNKKSSESFSNTDIKLEDIQVSTLNNFENHTILKNLGIKSKSKSISNQQLTNDLFDTTYSSTQEELIKELKEEAKSQNANGLLSVTINLINNPIEEQTNFICTANIVHVSEN